MAGARALAGLLLVALLPGGCLFVSDEEVDERYRSLTDADGDGHAALEYDGDDCDDSDPDVHPGAEETWYDGVDQDCDGASDYDADGDGHDAADYGGDDCDDEHPEAWPGHEETWYDGVDEDCQGGSDYDADGDGYDAADYGGDDCDDSDPDWNPESPEALADGVDGDCDGGDDSFRFHLLDQLDAQGVVGPVVAYDGVDLVLAWGADQLEDPEEGTQFQALCASLFDPEDPRAGPYDYAWLAYPDDQGTMGEAFDFSTSAGYWVWASSLYDDVGRTFMVDAEIPGSPAYGNAFLFDGRGAQGFDDIQLSTDEERAFRAVACQVEGTSWTLSGSLPALTGNQNEYVSWKGELAYSVGEYDEEAEAFVLADADAGVLDTYTLGADGSLKLVDGETGWSVLDVESSIQHGWHGRVLSDAFLGLVASGGALDTSWVPSSTPLDVDLAFSPSGVTYVCGVDASGGAWLWYGNAVRGMAEVRLDPGVEAERCGLFVTPGNEVLVAFRGEDQVYWGVVDGI